MAAGRGAAGEPLPPVFQALHEMGVRPRTGQVTLIAAPPNCGKSLLAMYWVIRLAQKGLRVLYFSADTDSHDSKIRAAAMLAQQEMNKIEEAYLIQEGDYYDDILAEELGNVRFDFETDPTYDHMAEVIQASCEMYGDYPHVIVVDNLMNVVTMNDNEWQGMKEVTKALKRMGRQTGAAIFTLHHVNEGHGDPCFPSSRKDIAGKVNQLPELILSLGYDDHAQILRVAAVKNRSGFKDASGKTYAEFYVNAPRMSLHRSAYDRQGGLVI